MIPHRNDNHLRQEIIGQDRIKHEVQKIGKGMTRKEPLGRDVTTYFIVTTRYYRPRIFVTLGGRGARVRG